MTPIKQLNKWSCLSCAFAKVLDLPEKFIHDLAGHTGAEPHGDEALGFHIQEMIKIALTMDKSVTPLDFIPICEYMNADTRYLNDRGYVLSQMENRVGVLTGYGLPSKTPHAVAWDGARIFDPNGTIYTRNDMQNHFVAETFWRIT